MTRFPGEDYIQRVEIFFHFDPLLALVTFISSRMVYIFFLPAVLTILVTIVLGRVACGWICPMGSIQQFFSFAFKKTKLHRPKKLEDNHTAWNYYLLFFIVVSSLFTLDLVGIFDPLSLMWSGSLWERA